MKRLGISHDYFIYENDIYFTIDLECSGYYFYLDGDILRYRNKKIIHTGIVTLFKDGTEIILEFAGGKLKRKKRY